MGTHERDDIMRAEFFGFDLVSGILTIRCDALICFPSIALVILRNFYSKH